MVLLWLTASCRVGCCPASGPARVCGCPAVTCCRLQDQLIVFMALAAGKSLMLCGELTLHTRTAISVAEQVLPAAKFSIHVLRQQQPPAAGGGGVPVVSSPPLHLVECRGAGIFL